MENKAEINSLKNYELSEPNTSACHLGDFSDISGRNRCFSEFSS